MKNISFKCFEFVSKFTFCTFSIKWNAIIIWMRCIGLIFILSDLNSQTANEIYTDINNAFIIRNSNPDSSFTLLFASKIWLDNNHHPEELAYYYHVSATVNREVGKFETADSLQKLAFDVYKELNDQLGVSIILMEKGRLYNDQGILDSAMIYYEKSKIIKEEINDKEGLGILYNNIGNVYDYKGEYTLAMKFYTQALPYLREAGNVNMEATVYHNLSVIQYNLGNMDEAIAYQLQAIPINKEINNIHNESMNYVCLSAYYLVKDSLNIAEEYGKKSLEINEKLNDRVGKLYALSALGDVYYKMGKEKEAEQIFDEFIKNSSDRDDPYMLAQIYEKKGIILKENESYSEAYNLLSKAFNTYRVYNNNKELFTIHRELAECLDALDKPEEAVNHYQSSLMYRDSVFDQEKVAAILDIEAKYQNEVLKAEQKLKEATISSQQNYLMGGTAGLALVSLLSFILYRQIERQRKLNLEISTQRDQIQILNSELSHRVKNNLVFMTSLLEMQERRTDDPQVKKVLRESESRMRSLSLLHSSLMKKGDTDKIDLQPYLYRIIDHLKELYDDPQHPLLIKADIQEISIKAEDAMRLGLIANELVTNSVKHAFGNDQDRIIHLELIQEEGQLDLVYNDGSGMTSDDVEKSSNSGSMGLKLIQLLVKQLGGKYKTELDGIGLSMKF